MPTKGYSLNNTGNIPDINLKGLLGAMIGNYTDSASTPSYVTFDLYRSIEDDPGPTGGDV